MKEFAAQCVYEARKEIRCKKCRRLLMKGEVRAIEIKCPKCGYVQKISEEVRQG
jgi:phage FluMu protein Com